MSGENVSIQASTVLHVVISKFGLGSRRCQEHQPIPCLWVRRSSETSLIRPHAGPNTNSPLQRITLAGEAGAAPPHLLRSILLNPSVPTTSCPNFPGHGVDLVAVLALDLEPLPIVIRNEVHRYTAVRTVRHSQFFLFALTHRHSPKLGDKRSPNPLLPTALKIQNIGQLPFCRLQAQLSAASK